jgi:ferredoxin-NADP reductase
MAKLEHKSAKVTVKGFFPDLLGWFKLPKKRSEWIDGGNPKLDTADSITELAGKLHSGRIPARIIEVNTGPLTRTYTLEPEEGRLPLFYAGQYLCLKFDIHGRNVSRSFSISSPPQESFRDNKVQFTLTKPAGDEAYIQAWETWKEGQRLRAELPFGTFYYSKIRDAAHIVGIAEGSGVAPFCSIAVDMLTSHRPEKLTLFCGSHTEALFKKELGRLAAESNGRLRIIHILSEAGASWAGEKGIISAECIKNVVEDYKNASFYVSGPLDLYDAVKGELDSLGIPAVRRRMYKPPEEESYNRLPYAGGAEQRISGGGPNIEEHETYALTVLFGQDRQELSAKSTETVAVALEKAGLAVDTQCGGGECGWCRSKLEAGSIWQRPGGSGVRVYDKEKGYFHPCSAYPVSNLTVRVFSRL